ncbi:hypothetical protein EIP86_006687 [Pleurotus ostreatoroseus]|nr:hypothetical protein EIP86_006687 [Pleurotus ostreatoroseus]
MEPIGKMIDALQVRNLFLAQDTKLPSLLVYKWCQGINNLTDLWETSEGECDVSIPRPSSEVYEKIDLTVLDRLLHLILDPNLADDITAKNNTFSKFKWCT